MEDSVSSFDYSDYNFIVEFPTCNSFRQILEFLNQNHKIIPLIFSKNKVSVRKANDKNIILFDGIIHAHNLTLYYIDESILIKPEEGEGNDGEEKNEPEFFIHVPIHPLLINLKRSQKKQKIRLSQKKGNESFLIIHSDDSSGMSSDIRLEPTKKSPDNYKFYGDIVSENPNITMQLSGFYFSSTGCGRISDRVSKIRAYKKGVKIFSTSTQGDSIIQKGNCSGDFICEIKLSGDIMKSISKLASLCDESIVRIYCDNEDYIRLEIPISVIGTAYLYLMTKDFSVE